MDALSTRSFAHRGGAEKRHRDVVRHATISVSTRYPDNNAFRFAAQPARPLRQLRASKIREVANAGIGREDIAAFWFGEPDEVTPEFIRQAAIDALSAGDTFYTHNLGIPELREAIAAYLTRLHRPTTVDHIAVTSSGMSALMVTSQALVGSGDRVVAVTPLWPNLVEIPKILGAQVETVALRFTPRAGNWTRRACSMLCVPARARCSSTRPTIPPAGPSTATVSARSWSIAAGTASGSSPTMPTSGCTSRTRNGAVTPAAPSFLDIAEDEDRVVSTNTFSKSWLMTGFRLGWIVAPRALAVDLPKLIEYNTSCAPPFVQRAGMAAITRGEPVIAHTVSRLRDARDYLVAAARAHARRGGRHTGRRDVRILPSRGRATTAWRYASGW